MENSKEPGLRYNQGKNRLSLVPTSAIEGIGNVLTYGASKYTVKDNNGKVIVDGANNWRKGMSWLSVLDSAKRHIAAFEHGIDIDTESNCLHLDHALTNLAFLREFYKIHPEYDDRLHSYLKPKRIGLDLDDVCVSWVGEWCKLHNLPIPNSWHFQYNIGEVFDKMRENGELDKFYENLPSLVENGVLPFDPVCYISHRPVGKELTEKWLKDNGFPLKPVYITKERNEKLKVCKETNLDYFIDDNADTFIHLNNNGICCFLMNTAHNQQINAGYKRIFSFADFKQRFL